MIGIRKYFFVFFLSFLVLSYSSCSKKKEEKLKEQITYLESEYVPMKFMITERKDEDISFSVKFFCSANAIYEKKYNLKGKELHFDFYLTPLSESSSAEKKFVIIPFRIFTDKIAPVAGEVLLMDEYMDGRGLPLCYSDTVFSTEDVKKIVSVIRKISCGQVTDDDSFGSVVHDLDGIKKFVTGRVYRIVMRSNGGIEVLEDD